MLDLASPVWGTLAASAGGSGTFAADLLRQVYAGDDSALDELRDQVCHQYTVGEVAYVVVPHLVALAAAAPPVRLLRLLGIVRDVAAGRQVYQSDAAFLSPEWSADYMAANDQARVLAATALQSARWARGESADLLGTLAALHGHADVAMLLDSPEPSCPACGDYIRFGNQ